MIKKRTPAALWGQQTEVILQQSSRDGSRRREQQSCQAGLCQRGLKAGGRKPCWEQGSTTRRGAAAKLVLQGAVTVGQHGAAHHCCAETVGGSAPPVHVQSNGCEGHREIWGLQGQLGPILHGLNAVLLGSRTAAGMERLPGDGEAVGGLPRPRGGGVLFLSAPHSLLWASSLPAPKILPAPNPIQQHGPHCSPRCRGTGTGRFFSLHLSLYFYANGDKKN